MKKILFLSLIPCMAMQAAVSLAGGDFDAGCNERVRRGDTLGEVLGNCGSPAYRYQVTSPGEVVGGQVVGGTVVGNQVVGGSVVGGTIVGQETTEVLVYEIGKRNLVFKVKLEEGRVVDSGKERP